jgi:hypothetical protein
MEIVREACINRTLQDSVNEWFPAINQLIGLADFRAFFPADWPDVRKETQRAAIAPLRRMT